jgi:hypothetical protein
MQSDVHWKWKMSEVSEMLVRCKGISMNTHNHTHRKNLHLTIHYTLVKNQTMFGIIPKQMDSTRIPRMIQEIGKRMQSE